MAGVTETEERIAREATDILALLGRPDLEVSSRQVVRWRVEANIFDLEGFQPVGRGNRRYYPANAPTIAAQFRLVLCDVRDLEEAVLVAFARGIPIAEFGLQKAYEHWFRSFQPLVARAQRPTKRSERILLPGPRRSGDDIVRYAIANVVLDKGVHEYEVESVIERLDLDEVLAAVDEGPSYFVEAVSSLAFSVLRKTSCRATRADLEWGRDTSRALFGFVIAVADRFSATGTEGAEPFHLAFGALGRTAKKMFGSRALPSPELGLAVVVPAMLVFASVPGMRRHLTRVAEALNVQTAALEAVRHAAESVPERWRRCFSMNFSSVIAGLPEAEREEFFADMSAWWDAHPEERAAIVASDTAARELHGLARELEERT